MFTQHRRRRQAKRAKPGDGSALPDYRFWQLVHRSAFLIDLESPAGEAERYVVDVHHLADDLDRRGNTEEPGQAPPVALYRNGTQVLRATPPVVFAVPGGDIEVARSLYGMTRMHYVPEHGAERTLTPHPLSLEGWRARADRRFPVASRVLGLVAIAVLLVGLALTVPQAIELITSIDLVAEHLGTFTSPISLPAWANTTLLVAGVLAATERALTLRNHWLIDADTTWSSLS